MDALNLVAMGAAFLTLLFVTVRGRREKGGRIIPPTSNLYQRGTHDRGHGYRNQGGWLRPRR